METPLDNLIGKKVKKIFISDDKLVFYTDKGKLGYNVEGDCCSASYFHDFIGAENLIKYGEVKSVKVVDLEIHDHTDDEGCVQAYGFQIFVQGDYDELTTVLSFRNDSNGYYSGWMNKSEDTDISGMKEVKNNWIAD